MIGGDMTGRQKMLLGGGLGALWSILIVWVPGQGAQPFIPINLALIYAFVPGGLVMMLVVLRIAERQFFSDEPMDSAAPGQGSRAGIDQRVLSNTLEQMVLALLLWPFAVTYLGAVTVIAMGVSMGVARLAFWIGYHVSPTLRLFGWSASFYPTVLATFWSLWRLLT